MDKKADHSEISDSVFLNENESVDVHLTKLLSEDGDSFYSSTGSSNAVCTAINLNQKVQIAIDSHFPNYVLIVIERNWGFYCNCTR